MSLQIVPILYLRLGFDAFANFSIFAESISCETSKNCQMVRIHAGEADIKTQPVSELARCGWKPALAAQQRIWTPGRKDRYGDQPCSPFGRRHEINHLAVVAPVDAEVGAIDGENL